MTDSSDNGCDGVLADKALEASWVVANRNMNRERQFSGPNSYEKDLFFDLSGFIAEREQTRWLDLCCGSGKALVQAAERFDGRLVCHGVDLVDWFVPAPTRAKVRFEEASLHEWSCEGGYDLITCVHGLHYIGDKLGLLERIASWQAPGGLFLGHLDLGNLAHERYRSFSRVLGKGFREHGFEYNKRTRVLARLGGAPVDFGYRYVGADDTAGPNYTGQDAVMSVYADDR